MSKYSDSIVIEIATEKAIYKYIKYVLLQNFLNNFAIIFNKNININIFRVK